MGGSRFGVVFVSNLHGGRRPPPRWPVVWTLVLGILLAAVPAHPELRFSNRPEVFLNDNDLTVQLVLLGAVPPAFHESLQSGVATHIRFYVELWRYSRFWFNERLEFRTVERQLTYDVVTKEYRVTSSAEKEQEPYVTKDLREAQRVASELRATLAPSSALDPDALYYIQARADVSVGGVNSFLSRLTGEAEETEWARSTLLTVQRTQ